MTKTRIPALLAAAALVLAACGTGTGAPQAAAPVAAPAAAPAAAPVAADETCPDESGKPPVVASIDPGRPSVAQLAQGANVQAIKRKKRLVVGTSGDVVLWGARNPTTGRLEGFDIEVAKDIARAIFGTPPTKEPPVEFRVINYSQRLPAVSDNEVRENQTRSPIIADLVLHTMTINCTRWTQIAFSSEYYHAGQKILVRSDNPKLDPKTGDMQITDLDPGTEICVPAGSTNVELLESKYRQFKPVPVPEIGECLVKFQRGEVGVITGDDTVLAGFAAQDPYARVVGARLSDEPYGIGIDRNKRDLVQFVNAVLQQLRDSGRWTGIYGATMGKAIPKVPEIPQAKYGR